MRSALRVVTSVSSLRGRGSAYIALLSRMAKRGRAGGNRPLYLRFPIREQVLFAKRLSMLMRAGMPVAQSLRMLQADSASAASAYIYTVLSAHVERGQPLSEGLAACSGVFHDLMLTMAQVGERSGTLREHLEYLAEELKRQRALRKKMLGALVYPAIVITATIIIALILTVYIFPKITPIFRSFHSKLPLPTRMVIAISSFLVHDGVWVIFGVIVLAVASGVLIRKPRIRFLYDTLILRVPLFGTLSRNYNLATLARTLGMLLRSDMDLVGALHIAAAGARNMAYKHMLEKTADEVGKGQPLSKQLLGVPRLVPPLYAQLVRAGEETGRLSDSLLYLSEMYEEDIDGATKGMATLIEPVLMIVMGSMIGFIALSIITPIYGITQQLGTEH